VRTKAGAAVPGAVVSLRRRPTGTGPRRTTIVNGVDVGADRAPCDPQGRFAIRGLEAGTYELTVLDDRGAQVAFDRADKDRGEKVELAANQQREGVDLVVEALDGVIRGSVVGPDNKPVADAWVTVTSEGGLFGGPRRGGPPPDDGENEQVMVAVLDDGGTRAGEVPPVLTGADGRFEVKNLRRGTYHVAAEGLRGGARGGADKVETGREVTIKLVVLSRLKGTVSLAGNPVTDFTIVARGPSEKRQEFHAMDGTFALSALDPGTYEVEARSDAGTGRASVTIEAAKESTVAIEIQAPGVVIGKVLDGSGAPVAGHMVVVIPRQPEGQLAIELDGPPHTTGADGSFRVSSEAGPRTLIVMGPQGPLVMKDIEVVGGKTVDLGAVTAEPGQGPGGQPRRGRG
jgi:hypothetical protein